MVTVSECDSSSGNEKVDRRRASACHFKTLFSRFTLFFTPITRKHDTLSLESPKFTSFSRMTKHDCGGKENGLADGYD